MPTARCTSSVAPPAPREHRRGVRRHRIVGAEIRALQPHGERRQASLTHARASTNFTSPLDWPRATDDSRAVPPAPRIDTSDTQSSEDDTRCRSRLRATSCGTGIPSSDTASAVSPIPRNATCTAAALAPCATRCRSGFPLRDRRARPAPAVGGRCPRIQTRHRALRNAA